MREKLLLHVCCAPCSIAVIDELRDAYDLTAFFCNPNISPDGEYHKRKREVVRVCEEWGIPMADCDHDPSSWDALVGGIVQESENGPRCSACTMMRIERSAEYAKAHGFSLFATSLTSSRRKNAAVINAQGAAAASRFGIWFLNEDWKKGGRTERGLKLAVERGIYRQRYCGCRFSLEDMRKRDARRMSDDAGAANGKEKGLIKKA